MFTGIPNIRRDHLPHAMIPFAVGIHLVPLLTRRMPLDIGETTAFATLLGELLRMPLLKSLDNIQYDLIRFLDNLSFAI